MTEENPLLKDERLPGETFRLPSLGLFYDEGVLDPSVEKGEIHVYPMTMMDEIIMRTPDKLLTGDSIKEVFPRVMPQILKPEELLQKDVDFLMICMRKVSYPEGISLPYEHDCKDAKEHRYAIDVTEFLTKTKNVASTKIKKDYKVVLDNGRTVTLQPVRYIDILALIESTGEDISEDEQRDAAMKALLGVIKAVDEVTNRDHIYEWLKTIPRSYTRKLSETMEKTTEWGVDPVAKIKCRDCGEEVEVRVPLNPITFFI